MLIKNEEVVRTAVQCTRSGALFSLSLFLFNFLMFYLLPSTTITTHHHFYTTFFSSANVCVCVLKMNVQTTSRLDATGSAKLIYAQFS